MTQGSSVTTFLMCEPLFYEVVYEINPWMHKEHQVNRPLATQQWQNLKQTMESIGATVTCLPAVEGWPDMVFTANAGLIYQDQFYPSEFRYPERQGERAYFIEYFKQAGFRIAGPTHPLPFEGAGDALFAGQRLFAATGFRSDRRAYQDIQKMGNFEISICELVDPYFYHMDTCFCPLNETQAIWWPGAFSSTAQVEMAKHLELFAVPFEEAQHFACNMIVLDRDVIIPAGTPHLDQLLKKLGLRVHHCDMSEYLKAGGACKCLTLQL